MESIFPPPSSWEISCYTERLITNRLPRTLCWKLLFHFLQDESLNSIFGNESGGGLEFHLLPCGLKWELRMLIASKAVSHLERLSVVVWHRSLDKEILLPSCLGKSVNMKLFLILIILLFEVSEGNLSKCTMKFEEILLFTGLRAGPSR